MTEDNIEEPGSSELSNFEASWWDATLEADHWLKLGALTPTQAALLLSGFNPHEGDVERYRSDEVYDDLRRLHERFIALASADRQKRTFVDWLAYAETNSLRHSPWARRYLEAIGVEQKAGAAAPKAEPLTTPPRSAKRRSWWFHAESYVVRRMREGKFKSAIELYHAIRNEPSSNDSPFETLSNGQTRELVIRATGRTVSLKTMQNKWTEIQTAADQ